MRLLGIRHVLPIFNNLAFCHRYRACSNSCVFCLWRESTGRVKSGKTGSVSCARLYSSGSLYTSGCSLRVHWSLLWMKTLRLCKTNCSWIVGMIKKVVVRSSKRPKNAILWNPHPHPHFKKLLHKQQQNLTKAGTFGKRIFHNQYQECELRIVITGHFCTLALFHVSVLCVFLRVCVCVGESNT